MLPKKSVYESGLFCFVSYWQQGVFVIPNFAESSAEETSFLFSTR